MDFSKFRDSGDLSDIVVVVEGHENHLHRFPLYAKSDYFCGVARGPGMTPSPSSVSKCRVELTDFPGGQEVFSVVADFCYNMAPKVTKDNVVQLRCAAQFLQMTGPANLAEAADRYLQDILTSAKLSRSSSPLVTLLLHCAVVGQLAADCGVVDTCTDALVDTLLRSPTKFSPPSHTGLSAGSAGGSAFSLQGSAFMPTKSSQAHSAPGLSTAEDDQMLKSLCRLPEDWFANLLKKALDRGVLQSVLADMAVQYVSQAINRDAGDGSRGGVQGGGINGHSTPISDAHNDGVAEAVEDVEDLDKDIDSLGAELEEVGEIGESPFVPERVVDLGQLLDTVLTTLPEEAYNVPSLTLEWLTKVLRVATARGCSCRRFLVKIAADMLTRLPAEELCLVSPSVLHDIVLEAKADDSQAERACVLVDTYLAEMAKKGVLTAETFRLLANATPADVRRNHDNLYEVLEYVLKSAMLMRCASKPVLEAAVSTRQALNSPLCCRERLPELGAAQRTPLHHQPGAGLRGHPAAGPRLPAGVGGAHRPRRPQAVLHSAVGAGVGEVHRPDAGGGTAEVPGQSCLVPTSLPPTPGVFHLEDGFRFGVFGQQPGHQDQPGVGLGPREGRAERAEHRPLQTGHAPLCRPPPLPSLHLAPPFLSLPLFLGRGGHPGARHQPAGRAGVPPGQVLLPQSGAPHQDPPFPGAELSHIRVLFLPSPPSLHLLPVLASVLRFGVWSGF